MKIVLLSTELETLERYQRNVSDRRSYVKVTCILMLQMGYQPVEVSSCLGIDDSTVYRYAGSFLQDGLEAYLRTDYKGYWGMLTSVQISELRRELNTTLYTEAKSVAAWIKERWGIEYTPQGTVDLLNCIGFAYKQTKQVPCEADVQAQEAFMEVLTGILEQTSESGAIVYYGDGVHPTHNTRSTHAWIEKGTEREQPTVSGRDRVNINAVLNAKDPVDVIALDCESVNAASTRRLYEKVLAKNPGVDIIYIITDNARYYRNKKLIERMDGYYKNKACFSSSLFPQSEPDRTLVEVLEKENYQYLLLPNKRKVQDGHPPILRKYRPI
jgi:transposase